MQLINESHRVFLLPFIVLTGLELIAVCPAATVSDRGLSAALTAAVSAALLGSELQTSLSCLALQALFLGHRHTWFSNR